MEKVAGESAIRKLWGIISLKFDDKANLSHTHSQYLTASDITNKENVSNKTTTISTSSTDSQYPTAKAVQNVVTAINTTVSGKAASSHTHAQSQITDLTNNLNSMNTAINGKAASTHNHDGIYLKTHQDISGKEDKTNKVTTINTYSTDSQYPSAKAVQNLITAVNTTVSGKAASSHTHTKSQITDFPTIPDVSSMQTTSNLVKDAFSGTTSNTKYPSEKLVKSTLDTMNTVINGKAASSHTHTKSQITDLGTIGTVTTTGTMTSGHVVVSNGGTVIKDSGYTIATSVPSGAKFTDTTYSAATQSAAGLMSAADKKAVDGLSNNYAAKSHTHTKSQITDFPTIPDVSSMQTISNLVKDAFSSTTSNTKYPSEKLVKSSLDTMNTTINGKASSSHTHTKSQITDFPTIPDTSKMQTTDNLVKDSFSSTTSNTKYPSEKLVKSSLDNKAASTHNHDSSYAAKTHTHTKSQITDFPTIPDISSIYNNIYPKGTVYLTTTYYTNNNFPLKNLIQGSAWSLIETDRYLKTITANTGGGAVGGAINTSSVTTQYNGTVTSSAVNLTISQMPNHSHKNNTYWTNVNGGFTIKVAQVNGNTNMIISSSGNFVRVNNTSNTTKYKHIMVNDMAQDTTRYQDINFNGAHIHNIPNEGSGSGHSHTVSLNHNHPHSHDISPSYVNIYAWKRTT